jgi:hypothetical protein
MSLTRQTPLARWQATIVAEEQIRLTKPEEEPADFAVPTDDHLADLLRGITLFGKDVAVTVTVERDQ